MYSNNDYWVLLGTGKRPRRGGGFLIVINAQNGCVELLTHGK
ncbi:MAG: YbbC/YhhH family protein [Vicingaceae bacterium]|nr:YbbC/YhhH family protein [Vicingaceae bacterium]